MSNDNPPADHIADDDDSSGEAVTSPAIEDNLKSKSTWIRLVFMVVFCFLAWVAVLVASAVVLLGFLWVLFTGETNEQLRNAGQGIANYVHQIIRYLTYNSDKRPFPFDAPWPSPDTE